MIDSGVFELKTAAQLLAKLMRDLDHLRKAPTDSDGWFNFLVTADHLVEWYCAENLPAWDPRANDEAAKRMREGEPLLRVCHHLSINAKHFKAKQPKQKPNEPPNEPPVAATNVAYVFRLNSDGNDPAVPAPRDPRFFLELSGREATEMQRDELSALDLAGMLVRYWREKLDPTTPPRPRHPLEGIALSSLAKDETPALTTGTT